MITTEKLDTIAKQLDDYRGNGTRGKDFILFDGRDHGNYLGYGFADTVAMLRRADPTGLSEGMLLDAMIEATITHSTVTLSKVLREEGYVAKLADILKIKKTLMEDINEPQANLMDYLASTLASISADMGAPTTREVAICLRDAIFCLEKGLTLRWLSCDTSIPMAAHVPICPTICQYADIAAFAEALRHELPFGSHLARIGTNNTAVGIKQPGKIAFLSAFSICPHTGQILEQRVSGSCNSDNLDLDKPIERYPDWVTIKSDRTAGLSGRTVATGAESHELNHISLIPRDKIIWFAMLTEMSAQLMSAIDPATVSLAESITKALPFNSTANLPMVIEPNWTVDELSLESLFTSLQLSEWEQRFLRPALDGITIDDILPVGENILAMRLDTKKSYDWPAQFGSSLSYSESENLKANSIRIVSISKAWVGSKPEVEEARLRIAGCNLVNWVMGWGNRRFKREWEEFKVTFRDRIEGNTERALIHPTTGLCPADFAVHSGTHLYSQSAKHSGYNPRCFFNKKALVDNVAHICPQSSEDLVFVLGMKSEATLPEFLRGWCRVQGWATSERHGRDQQAPYPTEERWCFRSPHRGSTRTRYLEASMPGERECAAGVDSSGRSRR